MPSLLPFIKCHISQQFESPVERNHLSSYTRLFLVIVFHAGYAKIFPGMDNLKAFGAGMSGANFDHKTFLRKPSVLCRIGAAVSRFSVLECLSTTCIAHECKGGKYYDWSTIPIISPRSPYPCASHSGKQAPMTW